MKLIDRLDKGHPDNREGMREHEHPYWNRKLNIKHHGSKIPENYYDRSPSQKAASDEERREHEEK